MDKNQVYRHLDKLREALIHLMISNQDFIDSIELSTSSNKAVTKRFDIWRKTIEEVIGNDTVQPRVFSIELKRKLFDLNPTCLICGNAIDSIDDSAIDHIEHYWKGGKTIPENARLTHRYCNWAREKK
jgi:5-methylcytosine-specific restriction endonuclease McrA